jgi:hypothetical protein
MDLGFFGHMIAATVFVAAQSSATPKTATAAGAATVAANNSSPSIENNATEHGVLRHCGVKQTWMITRVNWIELTRTTFRAPFGNTWCVSWSI